MPTKKQQEKLVQPLGVLLLRVARFHLHGTPCIGCWMMKQQSLVQQLGVLQLRVAYLHVVCLLLQAAGGCSAKSWCNSLACCSTEWPTCMLCAVVRLLLEDETTELGATAWRVAVQSGLLACCVFVAGGGWRMQHQELVQQLGALQHRVACLHVVRLLLEDAAPRVSATAWHVAAQSGLLAACCARLCDCCWRMQHQKLVQQLGVLQYRLACLQLCVCCWRMEHPELVQQLGVLQDRVGFHPR